MPARSPLSSPVRPPQALGRGRAVLAANFLTGSLPDGFVHSRGTTAWLRGSAGDWSPRATDDPLLGHHATDLSALGWYIPGAFTDYAHNRTFAGAVVGTIGAGGALPTGWSGGEAPGCTLSVEAVGSWNGLPTLRLRVQGSAPGEWRFIGVSLRNSVAIAAAQNDVIRAPMFIRRVAGVWPDGVATNFHLQNYMLDAGYAWVGNAGGAAIADPGTSLVRVTPTSTCWHASTAYCNPFLEFAISPGASLDVTFEIAAPMLVKNVPAPELVLLDSGTSDVTSSAEQVSRAIDLVPPFSFVVRGRTPAAAAADGNLLMRATSGAAGFWIYWGAGTTNLMCHLNDDAGYNNGPSSGDVAPNTRFAVAGTLADGIGRFSLNGAAAVALPGTPPASMPAFDDLYLGSWNGSLYPWWGFVESIRFDRGQWSDATLIARSTIA